MQSEIIQKLIAHIKSECKIIDQEAQYNDMLDECYNFASVGGIFATMTPSSVLKECDPTAYRCGMNDYFGTSGDNYEIDGDLYLQEPVDEARQEFTEELETTIADLEKEIEAAEEPDPADERRLAELQAELAEVEKHAL